MIVLLVGSHWLENGIYYDDGGFGAIVFLVGPVLGFAGILLNELLTRTAPSLHHLDGAGAWFLLAAIVIVACLPYLSLDAWSQRLLRRRTDQGE